MKYWEVLKLRFALKETAIAVAKEHLVNNPTSHRVEICEYERQKFSTDFDFSALVSHLEDEVERFLLDTAFEKLVLTSPGSAELSAFQATTRLYLLSRVPADAEGARFIAFHYVYRKDL